MLSDYAKPPQRLFSKWTGTSLIKCKEIWRSERRLNVARLFFFSNCLQEFKKWPRLSELLFSLSSFAIHQATFQASVNIPTVCRWLPGDVRMHRMPSRWCFHVNTENEVIVLRPHSLMARWEDAADGTNLVCQRWTCVCVCVCVCVSER